MYNRKALRRSVLYRAATEYLWGRWPMYAPTGLATYVFNRPEDFDVRGYKALQWASDVVSEHVEHNTTSAQ